MNSLYLIGFIQTIFLSLLILTKRKLKASDIYLFLFILVMGLRLLNIYFGEIGYYEVYPKLAKLISFIYWPLFGPLLYLYIDALTSAENKFRIDQLIHFVPAFIVLVVFAGYIYNNGDKITFDEYCQKGVIFQIGKFLWYYTTHIYFVFSIIKLHTYRKSIEHYFSSKKHINLSWLLIMTYGFGLFIFTSMFFILTHDFIPIELPAFYYHSSWFILVIYIFGIAYFGYKQKGVFDNVEKVTANSDSSENKLNKNIRKISLRKTENNQTDQYSKTRLNSNERVIILKNLILCMDTEKPYLNFDLNLRSLAIKIDTTPNKLSQVINTEFNMNFFEFVNEHRVKEAKEKLSNPEFAHEKIMNIAYDSGFNSKSSFFSVFKRFISQTPSEFKNNKLKK